MGLWRPPLRAVADYGQLDPRRAVKRTSCRQPAVGGEHDWLVEHDHAQIVANGRRYPDSLRGHVEEPRLRVRRSGHVHRGRPGVRVDGHVGRGTAGRKCRELPAAKLIVPCSQNEASPANSNSDSRRAPSTNSTSRREPRQHSRKRQEAIETVGVHGVSSVLVVGRVVHAWHGQPTSEGCPFASGRCPVRVPGAVTDRQSAWPERAPAFTLGR